MGKWIHNLSEEQKEYQGKLIDPSSYYQIPSNLLGEFQSDETLLSDILLGHILLSSNGTTDIVGGASSQIDFLKDVDITPRDVDGSPLSRVKVTKSGWHYQLHCIEFSTSKRVVDHSTHEDESDINFCVMKAYRADGTEITDDANLNEAVKTTITWEPTHTYDILGAKFYQLATPTESIRMYSSAAAHIPIQYGGNKRFVTGGFNLKFLPASSGFDIDGRAPKTVYYDSVNHSGSFTMIFKHPAGLVHNMMLVFELFKE